MVKKQRSKKTSYVTVSDDPDALGYREIAVAMNKMGYPLMTHTTIRHCIMQVMKKFASSVSKFYDLPTTPGNINAMAKDVNFQEGLREILIDMYATSKK